VPKDFQYLGNGYLPEWGPNTGMNNSTLLLGLVAIAVLIFMQLQQRQALIKIKAEVPPFWVTMVRIVLVVIVGGWLTWMFGTGRPGSSFPVPGLILVLLVILYSFVTGRMVTGRHIYAVGGNRLAAELSGVNTKKVYFLVMLNMSVLAAFAGMMFVGRSTASGPFDGVGWELDAIAAVFIGGAAVSGGVGTVIGSMIGGLVMAVLNNGLQLMSAGSDVTQMIKGVVLLVAVALDVWQKNQGRASITGMFTRSKELATTTPTETVLIEEQGANRGEPR
jgi:putative multiple sugar transport system permease protein